MRILVVQGGRNEALPSGEQVVITREVNSLRSDGHFVHLDHGIRVPSGSIARFLSKISGIIWSHANYRHVIELIETYKPSIIHFHSIVPYLSLSVIFAESALLFTWYRSPHGAYLVMMEITNHDNKFQELFLIEQPRSRLFSRFRIR